MAWPTHVQEWGAKLLSVQDTFVELCHAICDTSLGIAEQLEILVLDEDGESACRKALGNLPARYHHIAYDDIWLRDTAPLFGRCGPRAVAMCPQFNGWGGKFYHRNDSVLAPQVAAAAQVVPVPVPWVLEGGAIESNGEGTILTTQHCLLNPNRNPGVDQASVEQMLRTTFGAKTILWLEQGLINDHTDSHIDTIARFVQPGTILCMEPLSSADPNYNTLKRIASQLETFRNANNHPFTIVRIPSPGRIQPTSTPLPASYLNYYVSNNAVIVPTYDSQYDDQAVSQIASLFPRRKTVAINALALLSGGGAIHCITQPQFSIQSDIS